MGGGEHLVSGGARNRARGAGGCGGRAGFVDLGRSWQTRAGGVAERGGGGRRWRNGGGRGACTPQEWAGDGLGRQLSEREDGRGGVGSGGRVRGASYRPHPSNDELPLFRSSLACSSAQVAIQRDSKSDPRVKVGRKRVARRNARKAQLLARTARPSIQEGEGGGGREGSLKVVARFTH